MYAEMLLIAQYSYLCLVRCVCEAPSTGSTQDEAAPGIWDEVGCSCVTAAAAAARGRACNNVPERPSVDVTGRGGEREVAATAAACRHACSSVPGSQVCM